MVETPNQLKPKTSRIISTVLSPAVQLWLRSQVEQVEALQFQIVGGDRQILKGHIPSVSVAASRAIYQGLHLSQIELEGSDIRVNLGQAIKGKPLRLLQPVPVEGQLLLRESDLQASLKSPLLSTALNDLLDTFLKTNGITTLADKFQAGNLTWQTVEIETNQVTIFGTLSHVDLGTTSVVIRAGLQLVTPQKLQLNPLQIQIHSDTVPLNLEDFQIDLGSEVDLQELTLTPGQIACRGRLKVIP
ncbi:MAG TPA: DUF2993 domain-containing protein [Coleofasciculaceae cyanobacterium]